MQQAKPAMDWFRFVQDQQAKHPPAAPGVLVRVGWRKNKNCFTRTCHCLRIRCALDGYGLRFAVSHISRKTSEM